MYVYNVLQNLSKKQMLHIPVERQHLFENIKLHVFFIYNLLYKSTGKLSFPSFFRLHFQLLYGNI